MSKDVTTLIGVGGGGEGVTTLLSKIVTAFTLSFSSSTQCLEHFTGVQVCGFHFHLELRDCMSLKKV